MTRKVSYKTKVNIFVFKNKSLFPVKLLFFKIYLVTLPRTENSYSGSETYFLCTSITLPGRHIYGQHIEGALKLINYKLYPHALNYSAINLTCVQLMIDCIESSIYFFPSTQQHRFYNTGLGFIFPFLSFDSNCRSIYPTSSLKFSIGCLIVNSNLTFLKLHSWFSFQTCFPLSVLHVSNWLPVQLVVMIKP